MFRGPRKYSEYVQDVPKSIDWILKNLSYLIANNGGGSSTTVRTSDFYIATANQTDFTITATNYDFFDVYLNGARLISTEYTISSNVVTLLNPAEAGDEVILLSYSNVSIVSLDDISTVGSDLYLFYNY